VLTGDHRVGARGAFRIGLNEVSIGLPVPVLAMELARDRLAPAELTRATLLAQIYDPEAAVRAGYLDALAEPGEVLAVARTEAARLAALGRTPFRATKTRLRGKTIAHVNASLDADLQSILAPA
jgi:enoyl-CoA hydratase